MIHRGVDERLREPEPVGSRQSITTEATRPDEEPVLKTGGVF